MTTRMPPEQDILAEVVSLAAEWTGFSPEAIHRDKLQAAVDHWASRGVSPEQFLALARIREKDVVQTVLGGVSVGETYFFRHPRDFEWVASYLSSSQRPRSRTVLRAWSAGCATGEEAYSLAATLQSVARTIGTGVEVTGTDVLEENVFRAQRGLYAEWSVRTSGALLYPVFARNRPGELSVLSELRAVTGFAVHNLLDAPPERGAFDVIFCRNVLIYFSEEAARQAVEMICDALAPGGIAVFAPMDVGTPPARLVRVSMEGANIFQLAEQAQPARRTAPAAAAALRSSQSPGASRGEAVRRHLQALKFVDRGELRRAEVLLAELVQQAPEFLPGLLDWALVLDRLGQTGRAVSVMERVSSWAAKQPNDALVPGPEPLPISYYRASADAYLTRRRSSR